MAPLRWKGTPWGPGSLGSEEWECRKNCKLQANAVRRRNCLCQSEAWDWRDMFRKRKPRGSRQEGMSANFLLQLCCLPLVRPLGRANMEPAGEAAVFCWVPAPASQVWVQKGRYIFTVIFTAIIQSIHPLTPEGIKLLIDLSLGLVWGWDGTCSGFLNRSLGLAAIGAAVEIKNESHLKSWCLNWVGSNGDLLTMAPQWLWTLAYLYSCCHLFSDVFYDLEPESSS